MLYRFLLLSVAASAQATELDTVVVKSTTQSSLHDVAQSVVVIDEEALRKQPAKSLGELLEQQPGISNAAFGPGVGRPVLRGLSGSRVKTMVNGHDSADLSAMSSDHAPMAEIANARQVEVIQGPATLLYGSGAIGGIVNVLDQRIHQEPVEETSGRIKAGIGSNDQAKNLAAEVNTGNGNWALHLNSFKKNSSDYHSGRERIENSDTESEGGSLGFSLTSEEHGYAGASISVLEQDYGVPNEDNSPTRVRPQQVRSEIAAGWKDPFAGIDMWETHISYTDYEHDELTLPVTEGLFEKDTLEFGSRWQHATIGDWQGTFGIHYYQQEIRLCHDHTGCDRIPDHSDQEWNGTKGNLFTQVGDYEFVHDTPMPVTDSSDIGYFLVESTPWNIEGIGQGHAELGARIDFRTIEADPVSISPSSRQDESYYDDKYFAPVTFSAAGTWQINDIHQLAISISRAQRAPDAEELYWNGDHHATFSYQLDNIDLKEETAYTADLIWKLTSDRYFIRTAMYHYRFDGFIFNDLKSVTDPFHSHPVYRHEQKDATFTGFEFSWEQQLTSELSSLITLDSVRARLTEGENKHIPRTPPATASLQLNWSAGNWSARAENHWVAEQNDVADGETSSDGYQKFNLAADYSVFFGEQELTTTLLVSNLFNEPSTNHVSYLKDYAPNPGRNIQLQAQLQF